MVSFGVDGNRCGGGEHRWWMGRRVAWRCLRTAAACDLHDPTIFIVPGDDGCHGGGIANVTPAPSPSKRGIKHNSGRKSSRFEVSEYRNGGDTQLIKRPGPYSAAVLPEIPGIGNLVTQASTGPIFLPAQVIPTEGPRVEARFRVTDSNNRLWHMKCAE